MLPYICCFCVSNTLLYFSDRKNRNQKLLLGAMAVLILCVLAGLRDVGIGTDTRVYLNHMIEGARTSGSFESYLEVSWLQNKLNGKTFTRHMTDLEPAFFTLVYVLIRLTDSVFWVQFVISLLVVAPVYAALYRQEEIPTWFGMLVFECFFFHSSLNGMRQAIAISFVFLAMQYLHRRRWIPYLICLAVAFLFHKSALMGLLLGALSLFLSNDTEHGFTLGGIRFTRSRIRFLIALTAILLIIPLTGVLVDILKAIGLEQYAIYLSGDISFLPNQIIKMLPALVLFILGYRQMHAVCPQTQFYFLMIVLTIVINQYASVFPYSTRISEFFCIFYITAFPMLCCAQKEPKKRCFFTVCMIGYLIFYWWFYYVYSGSAETIPYRMMPF